MALKVNINNERLTNHSARKHMIQKLNDNDIPPTHIMQLSGHKNVQSITNYSGLILNQQKNISCILSRTSQTQTTISTSTSGTAAASTSKTPMNFFQGVVISGGQFMISVNALKILPRQLFKPGRRSLKPPKRNGRESELRSPTQIKLYNLYFNILCLLQRCINFITERPFI